MHLMLKGALWIGIYTHVILLPLLVGVLWPGPGADRPFPVQFGAALGYAGLTVMLLELALVSKIKWIASAFGQDALLQFHRLMGLFGLALIGAHLGLELGAGYPAAWLNPFAEDSPWAMRWGVWATAMFLLLTVLSLGRRALRVSYEWWQVTHGALADLALAATFVHVLLFGGFAASTPVRILLLSYAGAAVILRSWFRFVRPLLSWSRPWSLVENINEQGDTRTLVLRPAGHAGFTFEPGQFAWLSTGATPFHPDRHPISMSSAAHDEPGHDVAFTIKNLGDWSGAAVPALQAGQRVWVDGPYGVFSPDREQGFGYALIAGGAGIGPLVSMCATFELRGDARPVVLFYAGRNERSLPLRRVIDDLSGRINLKVVYVVEDPPPGWTGEAGRVNTALLRKHLPPQYRRFQYFICGPEPMMDSVESALVGLGVPFERIHTERFVNI